MEIEILEARKRCIECGLRLVMSDFHKASGRSYDGRRNVCKQCRRDLERNRQRSKRG